MWQSSQSSWEIVPGPKRARGFFFRKKSDDTELCRMCDSHLKLLSEFAVQYRVQRLARDKICKSPIVSQDLEILEGTYLEILYWTANSDNRFRCESYILHNSASSDFFRKKIDRARFGPGTISHEDCEDCEDCHVFVDYLLVEWEVSTFKNAILCKI